MDFTVVINADLIDKKSSTSLEYILMVCVIA